MERTAFLGDWHVPFHCDNLPDILKEITKEAKHVVVMGDAVDFYQVSHYRRDPSRLVSLGQDIERAAELLAILKKVKGEKYFILGNHELRLVRYLADHAPELVGLKSLDLTELLGLDRLGFTVVDGLYLKKKFGRREWLIFHGDHFGKNGAYKNLETYGANGITGHSHRLGVIHKTTFGDQHTWIETGCLVKSPDREPSFYRFSDYGKFHDWHRGYVLMSEREIVVVNDVC